MEATFIDLSHAVEDGPLCGLDALPECGFRFFAVPVKVRRLGTFPVRTFAIIPPGVS